MTTRVVNRVLGVDLSMNHAGLVVLDDGEPTHYRFVTDRQSTAKKSKALGTYIKEARIRDMHVRSCARLDFWWKYLDKALHDTAPEYLGVEDYAYGAGRQAHQVGEVGGLLRLLAWRRGVKIRLHSPYSLKKYVAHDGSADKREVAHHAKERWDDCRTFERYVHELPKGSDTTVEEDLCEAFALAKLVWLEVQLRSGDASLSSLHPKEVQVFNHVSQQWPVNILGREWLRGESR